TSPTDQPDRPARPTSSTDQLDQLDLPAPMLPPPANSPDRTSRPVGRAWPTRRSIRPHAQLGLFRTARSALRGSMSSYGVRSVDPAAASSILRRSGAVGVRRHGYAPRWLCATVGVRHGGCSTPPPWVCAAYRSVACVSPAITPAPNSASAPPYASWYPAACQEG